MQPSERRTTGSAPHRRHMAALVSATVLCLAAAHAHALINLHYTPVDLMKQSDTILYLRLGPIGKNNELPVRVLKAVKGKAPGRPPVFDLKQSPQHMVAILRESFWEGDSATAVLCVGRGKEGDGEEAGPSLAVLLVGVEWFNLSRARRGAGWILGPDDLDMRAVWAGSADMLMEAARYAVSDPNAVVPVRAGASWDPKSKARVAMLEGKAHGMAVVDLVRDGCGTLFIACETGDRLLRYDEAGTDQFADVTAPLKLSSKSTLAAWADFNADTRLDLASWDGSALTLWLQGEDGAFSSRAAPVETASGWKGLAAIDVGGQNGAGLLVSTGAAPVLLRPSAEGGFAAEALPAPEGGSGTDLGRPAGCIVADFDGDALPDVVQYFEQGGLFYKGLGAGKFRAPTSCGDVFADATARAYTGDFEADGRLDIILFGEGGCYIWTNLGGGKFREILLEAGEPAYIGKEGAVGGAVGDPNNDGRQDFLMFYERAGAHTFFNRGFRCFGYALELGVVDTGIMPEAADGQQAGVLADLNGDGAQDIALVLADGGVWVLFRDLAGRPGLGVRAALGASGGFAGPLTVAGWSGKRPLGARNVVAGAAPAFFGRTSLGPVTLKWQFPGGDKLERVVILESGPLDVYLGPDAAVVTGAEAAAAPAGSEPAAAASAGDQPSPAAGPAAQPDGPGGGLTKPLLIGFILAAGTVVLLAVLRRRGSRRAGG